MLILIISPLFVYRTDCIEKKDSPEVYFCCCEGNMCNERFSYFPEMEVTQRKFTGKMHMSVQLVD